ncbi:hypothetical protein KUTeg_022863 [Tegillarca granosa]|uniref:UHRF1-binding protein 1-like n=1 Tax=Tegillarca granosa TaxID=220873 RepID=A0ABQ9E017_TEGGR|nr:hypothetical protein KUTeg_022863 [Tegillarca granosa]
MALRTPLRTRKRSISRLPRSGEIELAGAGGRQKPSPNPTPPAPVPASKTAVTKTTTPVPAPVPVPVPAPVPQPTPAAARRNEKYRSRWSNTADPMPLMPLIVTGRSILPSPPLAVATALNQLSIMATAELQQRQRQHQQQQHQQPDRRPLPPGQPGFTKNLSQDKINLSTFKGEDSVDKIEIPANYFNEVILEVETCDEPRPPNNPAHMASYRSGGKYGFVDRVIDVRSMTPNWQKAEHLQSTRIKDTDRGEILLFKEVDWQTTRIEATAVEGENDEQFVGTPLRFIANQSKIRITMKKRLSDCCIISTRVMLLLDDLLWVLTTTQLKAAILYADSLKEIIKKSREQSKKLAAEKLQQQQQSQQRQRSQSNSNIARLFTRYDVQTTSYHVISSRIDLHLCDDSTPDTNCSPKHDKRIEGGAMQIVFYKLSVDIYPYYPAGGERKSWYRYTDNQGSRNHWVQQLFSEFKKEVTKARETCCVASPSQSPAHHPANQRTPEKTSSNQNQVKSPGSVPQQTRPQSSNQSPRPRTTKLLESCTVLKVEEFTIYRISTADNLRNTPHKFLSSDKKQLHLPSDMSVIHAEYTEYYFPEGIDYPVPHANLYILVNPIRLTVDYLTLLWLNYFILSLSNSVVIVPSEVKSTGQPDRPEGLQLQISRLTVTNSRVEEKMTLNDLKTILEDYKNGNLFNSMEFPNDKNELISVPKHFHDHAYGLENPYIQPHAKGLLFGQLPNDYQVLEEGNLNVTKLLKTNTLKRSVCYDIWSVTADQVWLEFVGAPNTRNRPIPFVESFPVSAWVCYPPIIDQANISQKKTGNQTLLCNGDIKRDTSESDSNSSEKSSPERESRSARKLLKHYYEKIEDSEEKTEKKDDNQTIREEERSHKAICDNTGAKMSPATEAGENVQYSTGQVADLHIVAKVGGKIKAQMTHLQYLFVLRMIESFTNFQLQMAADIECFLGNSGPGLKFSIPLIIPELEFAMVCPYVAELLQYGDHVPLSPGAVFNKFDDINGIQLQDSDSTQELQQEDQLIEVHSSHSGHGSSGLDLSEVGNAFPQESLNPSSHSHSLSMTNVDTNVSIVVSADQTRKTYSSGASDSGYSAESKIKHMAKKGVTADQVKKSFTSALSGFTDKIKAKMDIGEDNLSVSDDLDAMSIRTDTSDDDEDFELLSLEEGELPAFQHDRQPETASSTGTDIDDLSSLYAESSTATKGRELISVILFYICDGEISLQANGSDTTARIQAKQLLTQQPGNMYYEEFCNRYASLGFVYENKIASELCRNYPVKLKFVSGPGAEVEAHKGEESGYMDVKADSCTLEFTMSSLANLSTFVEDEKISDTLPMHLSVTDLGLTLKDDRPPPIGSTITPQPLKLFIHKLDINRGHDGVFQIAGTLCFFNILVETCQNNF